MAREAPAGTPSQPRHYVWPRPALRFVWAALLLGGAFVAGAALLLATPEAWGLRRALAPGGVAAAHATTEARCQSCHLGHGLAREASDARCLRCHGSASSSPYLHPAHVLFGGGDPEQSSARGRAPQCAACHVEHRGRRADLKAVGDAQCYGCHFKSFASHPEFQAVAQKRREAPGLIFPHERHLRADALAAYQRAGMAVAPVTRAEAACVLCHEPERQSRDLQPLAYARHCARCHTQELQLGTEPVPQQLVVLPRTIAERGDALPGLPADAEAAKAYESQELQLEDGEVRKKAAAHADPWILYNRAALGRAQKRQEHEQQRAALLAERVRLLRRLALQQPLAELDERTLRQLQSGLQASLAELRARRAAQAGAADSSRLLARAQAVAQAAAAAADPALRQRASGLLDSLQRAGGAAPQRLTARELDEARRALLETLRALREADKQLAPQADRLAGRLEALAPGETSAEALQRVIAQRESDLVAASDELRLIEAGVREREAPTRPMLTGRDKPLREALSRLQRRLALAALEPPPAAAKGGAAVSAALTALWNPCKKCHAPGDAPLEPVAAARHTFARARFAHEPHLRAALGQAPVACGTCHGDVLKSARAEDLHLPASSLCRSCHNARAVSDTCLSCHRYHPLELP